VAGGLGKIDWIVGVQGRAEDFVAAAVEAGHPRDRTRFFENSGEAAKFLERFVSRGDLLLLKGSRGVKMERILEAIDAQWRRAVPTAAPRAVEAESKGRG